MKGVACHTYYCQKALSMHFPRVCTFCCPQDVCWSVFSVVSRAVPSLPPPRFGCALICQCEKSPCSVISVTSQQQQGAHYNIILSLFTRWIIVLYVQKLVVGTDGKTLALNNKLFFSNKHIAVEAQLNVVHTMENQTQWRKGRKGRENSQK